jgi:ribose transport system substrate-binding protein
MTLKIQLTGVIILNVIVVLLLGCDNRRDTVQVDRIALVMKASSNPFFVRMEEGAQRAADSLGLKLLVGTITRETDIDQQIAIVENMIVQGVKAILIAPADSKAITSVLKRAQDNGIHVINIDNRIDLKTAKAIGLAIACYVGVDNEEGGRMAGEYLAALLQGEGKVAMLEGIRGVDNAEARKNGFLRSLQNTDIELVASQSANWAQDQGLDVFTNMLQANPDIQGLFCANDMMALGAVQAIDQAGKTGKIFVTSYDNLKAAREAILQDKLHATVEQHPELMGYESVVIAQKLIRGGRVPGEKLVRLNLITRDNLGR